MTQLALDGSTPAEFEPGPEPVVKTLAPLARGVLEAVAVEHGVCIRPVPMRRVDLHTGAAEMIYVPCNHTLASVCPSCAERKRKLRAVQCSQGWHLETEPVITRADPDDEQSAWMELRAQAAAARDRAAEEGSADGEGPEFWDAVVRDLDNELERTGVRGALKTGEETRGRRTRSTRRRQDAPDLPRRPVDSRTVGKVYRGRDGKTFRPSIFLTLTLDSYGRVRSATGEVLPTWDEALEELGQDADAEPLHVVRFGRQIDAQGVMPDSPESRKLIGYLTKYLVKGVAECHIAETGPQREHLDRMAETLRYEPCSPTCANWLRYGVQPKNPRKDLTPGYCKGKAHRHEHLGYGGRRVLVSRKWSGKTLADHKADRKAWVLARLAEAEIPVLNPTDPNAVHVWERAGPGDPDVKPTDQRLLLLINERIQRRRQLDQATSADLSATESREAA